GPTARSSVDRPIISNRTDVWASLLDAPGLAATTMGSPGRIPGRAADWPAELLDEQLLRLVAPSARWSAGSRSPAADSTARAPERCAAHGARARNTRQYPPI